MVIVPKVELGTEPELHVEPAFHGPSEMVVTFWAKAPKLRIEKKENTRPRKSILLTLKLY
jgi:hypothetical protein